ncbi:uncharacterized protein LOC126366103 [Pectinophora gossypiella]|uniref:uncharacterized protein LOC126366103 n=1 Tax=Pectinophora gossypiella TaxID=13191 RepID=UPI00214F3B97|nr:uncharacterized protein LOC126366103 [Pectinophora gossypiella]
MPKKRKLPKLMACLTKTSLENLRNKALFSIDVLDAKGIRRRKKPLYECLILELKEAGYIESSSYLQDLLYDNAQLVAADDIGIVTDLRTKNNFLEHICSKLQLAERERERNNTKKECLTFLQLGLHYAELGKGILWLAEKFFLASIAVASRFQLDGGRLKGVCKYHYARFLLDKFPGADPEESFVILTDVRDSAIGRSWPLYEPEREGDVVPPDMLFCATAIQLHRVLLSKARAIRKKDPAKAERLSRLAERRGQDADDPLKTAEAVIEVGISQLVMNNLNNSKKTFERAFKIYTQINNMEGLCVTRMHLAAVMQRLGDHETSARLLTEMGALAMEYALRRQLGRALHLLGELHLRRERPDLGTQHLTEAFACFMGYAYANSPQHDGLVQEGPICEGNIANLDLIFKTEKQEEYREEAEQSRLMTAISAGQELMASYFALLRDARTCTVATVKCIEWKLAKYGWWVKRVNHDLMPCICPMHNRTPLDVLWHQIELRNQEAIAKEMSEGVSLLTRNDSCDALHELASSTQHKSEVQAIKDAAEEEVKKIEDEKISKHVGLVVDRKTN